MTDQPETRPGYLTEFVDDSRSNDVDSDTASDDEDSDDQCERPDELPVYQVSDEHIPQDFRDIDVEMWVLWNSAVKVPLAPWMTATLKATPWASDLTHDYPETTLEKVLRFADEEMAMTYGATQMDMHDEDKEDPYADVEFANVNDPRVDLKPAPLLLHEDPDHSDRESTLNPPIMLIDLDSVRCPDCATVVQEAHQVVQDFDAYTEVSMSGTGLHVWARGSLPGGFGELVKRLGEASHPCLDNDAEIEMYDHGRFNGATWRHVDGTPRDRVPERQDTVETIVDRYATPEDAEDAAETALTYENPNTDTHTSTGTRNRSPYYNLPLDPVFDQCPYAFRRHSKTQRDWDNGPHPVHGPDKSDVDKCTNFGTKDGKSWFCFWHGDKKGRKGKGGALSLIAVNEGWTDCKHAYRVYDTPELLTAACLAARDKYGFVLTDNEGESKNPPIKALYGLLTAAGRDDLNDPQELMYADDTGETDSMARQVAEQMWEDVVLDEFVELADL